MGSRAVLREVEIYNSAARPVKVEYVQAQKNTSYTTAMNTVMLEPGQRRCFPFQPGDTFTVYTEKRRESSWRATPRKSGKYEIVSGPDGRLSVVDARERIESGAAQ